MTKYAITTVRSAKLSEDFARDWVRRLWGDDALDAIDDSLPKFKAGKNVGKPKGLLKWWKAETAGYAREVQQGVRPGTIRVELWTGPDRDRDLCFGVCVLGHPQPIDRPRLQAFKATQEI